MARGEYRPGLGVFGSPELAAHGYYGLDAHLLMGVARGEYTPGLGTFGSPELARRGYYGERTHVLMGASEVELIDEGNKYVSGLEARTNDLAKNWHPTGHYRPPELQKALLETLALIHQAVAAIAKAPLSSEDALYVQKMALDRLRRNDQEAMAFIEALKKVPPGGVIEAPGFRDWVIRSMINTQSGLVTAYVHSKNLPWFVKAVATFQGFFDKVVDAAEAAGAVILDDVIIPIIKVPYEAVKSVIVPILAVAGVAGAGVLTYMLLKK